MKATIKLTGRDYNELDSVARKLKEIALKAGVKVSGPVPLPTKKLVVQTRKNVHGRGTETWDRFEMRIHKRLLVIEGDDRVLRQIMKIQIPEGIEIEIVIG